MPDKKIPYDCGYGEHTSSPNGADFDCLHEDRDTLDCDHCPHNGTATAPKRDCNNCQHMRLYERPEACVTAVWDTDRNCSNWEDKGGAA